MTHGAAVEPEPTPPPLRNPEFKEWVDDAIEALQAAAEARGETLTIGRIAERGRMSHGQLNRWRGIGGPQSLPTAPYLLQFCAGNRLDPAEPFRILGWGEPPPAAIGGDDPTVEAVLALLEVARDPRVGANDREWATSQLELITEILRRRRAKSDD